MYIQELKEQMNDNPESLSNKSIILYGWAAEVQKRITKNGKEYYTLKLQDTTGSIDLFINNELAEQSQIKYHLNDLKCYRIKGKIEKRSFGVDNSIERWDLRVNEVIELEQLIKEKAELKVLLNVKDIQLNLIKEFEKIFKTNGGIPLKVTLVITDDERKNYVSTSNPLKINFDDENFKLFEKYNLEYKIVFNS
jgi:DNA polymerase III alpha subunit